MRRFFLCAIILIATAVEATARTPDPRAKFYDFSDQLIDGEIKKPTTLYTDARENVKFERLLRLKKSFMEDLFQTAKDPVFR